MARSLAEDRAEDQAAASGGGVDDDEGRSKPAITWDEDTIAEHDKLRGTRMKIDEPDTPFNYEYDEEYDAQGTGRARDDLCRVVAVRGLCSGLWSVVCAVGCAVGCVLFGLSVF